MHDLLVAFWLSSGQQLHELLKYCNWFIGTGLIEIDAQVL